MKALVAETLGTALLLAAIVGSGIMGQTLAGGNDAIALLCNTVATGSALVVLITVFGPVSGAHFNPLVTAYSGARGHLTWPLAAAYMAAQLAGAVIGVWTAHLMFGQAMLQVSAHLRDGPAQVFAEAVATFGLFATILGSQHRRPDVTPAMVGLYITAAYWFTASTSFANPAVTLARSMTASFAGIAPASIPGFIAGQLLGAAIAAVTLPWLFSKARPA